MTPDKAIKVLGNLEDPFRLYSVTELQVAAKLGIEALKGIMKVRRTLEPYVTALLPGETED